MRKRTAQPSANISQVDLAALLARVVALEKIAEEAAVLRAENERLKIENKLLRHKVDFLTRKLFGQSAERLDPRQMQMDLNGLVLPASPEPAPPPPPPPPPPATMTCPDGTVVGMNEACPMPPPPPPPAPERG